MSDAKTCYEVGLKEDPNNEDLKEMMEELNLEIKADNVLKADHPERVAMKALEDKLTKENGAVFRKVKMRWENEYYRYGVAT
jgi:hypothetical protein